MRCQSPSSFGELILRCLRICLTVCHLFFLLHYAPFVMLLMYKNVPIVTICWVTFFTLCFLIFLVLSLCRSVHDMNFSIPHSDVKPIMINSISKVMFHSNDHFVKPGFHITFEKGHFTPKKGQYAVLFVHLCINYKIIRLSIEWAN